MIPSIACQLAQTHEKGEFNVPASSSTPRLPKETPTWKLCSGRRPSTSVDGPSTPPCMQCTAQLIFMINNDKRTLLFRSRHPTSPCVNVPVVRSRGGSQGTTPTPPGSCTCRADPGFCFPTRNCPLEGKPAFKGPA